MVDRVLERHEGTVRVAEHRVGTEVHREREHLHVLRHALERPGARIRVARRCALVAHVHEVERAAIAERVEVVVELVVVEARTAVQDDERDRSVAARDDVQARVVDPDEPTFRHPAGPSAPGP